MRLSQLLTKTTKDVAAREVSKNAILLTQAELQIDRGQHEQALATLKKLEENSPNHGQALVLLGRLYFRLEDWSQLAALLGKLKKYGRIDEATLRKWSVTVHREQLVKAADSEVLAESWNRVPRDLKNDIQLLQARYRA